MKSLSQVDNFYLGMMTSIITDVTNGAYPSRLVTKDISYVTRRYREEGLYFFTSELPKLGKALDEALETGVFSIPPGFSRRKDTNLPKFLFDKFNTVFSPQGTILDQPDAYSVQELRQIFYLLYKLETPSPKALEFKALEKFVSTEEELADASFGHLDPNLVLRAQKLIASVLHGLDWRDIIPSHGPGGVNTGEKGNEKWTFKRVYSKAFQCYPWYDYFISNRHGEISDRLSWIKSLLRHDESWSKVCLVPKDSRGPRVISIEPLETQYLQQGQMRLMVKRIEKHPLTRGRVNFSDQSVNGNLALQSSRDGRYATLDLSEASDRVHVNLFRILFPEEAVRFLESTRSEGTILPCGKKVKFRKFAPMGSANCFPVLALTIWSLIRAYLDSVGCHDECYVYGDDVVIPSAYFHDICLVLEDSHLRVNRQKSFVAGSFRESCGVDAYKGVVVTPLRLRRPWSGKSRDSSAFQSYTSLSNDLFARGWWNSASYVQVWVERLYGKIPYGSLQSGFPCIKVKCPILAERLNKLLCRKVRWNAQLQRWEFLVRSPRSSDSDSPINDWPRLLKGLLKPSISDPSRVVFRQVPKLVWRWSAI